MPVIRSVAWDSLKFDCTNNQFKLIDFLRQRRWRFPSNRKLEDISIKPASRKINVHFAQPLSKQKAIQQKDRLLISDKGIRFIQTRVAPDSGFTIQLPDSEKTNS